MNIQTAQQLKPGDRIHAGPANATVIANGERIEIEWDHGARQSGRHQRMWMFELGDSQ